MGRTSPTDHPLIIGRSTHTYMRASLAVECKGKTTRYDNIVPVYARHVTGIILIFPVANLK